ncbi:chemotaxis protein CheB [Hydrogenophaga sp.]|uniref:chemotaxis protein CheB n=1 Tax=Hydrogenophaga sp. TaxID=1904254 RepID=UPI003F6FD516
MSTRYAAVVIGGSSGGIEALITLLPALPPTLRASVLIVMHMPRHPNSLLLDIFKPRCPLPLREAQDQDALMPGTVYFCPPDYHLLLDQGPRVALSVDAPVHYSRPSIDVLFESAADLLGEQLVGVLLSGGNEDGARGIQAIHAAGGLVVVQEPTSAPVATMPLAALARVRADHVLAPADIGTLFLDLHRQGHL